MKVFGVGLNKTGTKTLGVCLKTLGFAHTSFNLELTRYAYQGKLEPIFDVADRFDSFEDWPWPLLYRPLDRRYPGSKFVLTRRATSAMWFDSLCRHAERTGPTEFRTLIFGHAMPHDHPDDHIAFYETHNAKVKAHFASRADDLLEVCWETGSGWTELCAFLGIGVPDLPFPHTNRGGPRQQRSDGR